MSNTILIKRSSEASKVPTTSDLQAGELGINITDKKLYSSDGSRVFEVGENRISDIINSTLIPTDAFFDNTCGYQCIAQFTQSLRRDRFYLCPFFIPKSITTTEVTCHVNSATQTPTKMGIYEENSSSLDHLFSFQPDTSTTGLKVFSSNFNLYKHKLYYLYIIRDDNSAYNTFTGFRPTFNFGRSNNNTQSQINATKSSSFFVVDSLTYSSEIPNSISKTSLTFDNDDYNNSVPLVCFKIGAFL